MSALAFHPLADIFPLLEGAEFAALVEDIAEHGLREPIKLYNGQIIDGRNRYRACLEANIDPRFEAYGDRDAYRLEFIDESEREYHDGASEVAQFFLPAEGEYVEELDFSCPYRGEIADPVAYVVSLNLKRRHLSEGQRGMVAAKLANLGVGRPRDNGANLPDYAADQPGDGELFPVDDVKAESDPVPPVAPVSIAQAAGLLNVSERTVKSARAVQREGAPELVAAVERGEISVSTAAEVATLPKPEQIEVVAMTPDEIVSKANKIKRDRKELKRQERKQTIADLASAANQSSRLHDIYRGSCADALKGDADSVDWIITDPPYPKEFLHVYEDLAKVAAHALKPGGSLLCMIGQSYLPDILATLSRHLTYHWTIAYLTPGGQAVQVFPRRVNTFWKPVLWFVKGEFAGSWIGDNVTSKTNDNDKRFHEWGQSESGMRDLMTRFVKPGDVVLDPFMGGGTTGVIALELKARFFGFEPNEDSYNEAVVRIDRAALVA